MDERPTIIPILSKPTLIITVLDYYSKTNNKEDESLLLLIGVYGDEQNNHHTHTKNKTKEY